MRIIDVADLPSLETTVLGPGRWHEVSQRQINQFADATGDHQWIHIGPSGRRAVRSAGPPRTDT
jgi:acyl dehydratase